VPLSEKVEKNSKTRHATDDNIIWYMRFVRWVNNATDTLTICNIYRISKPKIVARTYINVTSYVRCLSCCIASALTEVRWSVRREVRVSRYRPAAPAAAVQVYNRTTECQASRVCSGNKCLEKSTNFLQLRL